MKTYRYSLIRFVADPLRMEPVNVGVILQDDSRLDFQLNPNLARRGNVETNVFRLWKEFLDEEIRGRAMPLFQPKKTSATFFSHLHELCDGAIRVSEPLAYQIENKDFDEVLRILYERLVAPPTSSEVAESGRPSGRFRQLMDQYDFLKRGMKRHSHLELADKRRWMPYRHVLNGEALAIDRVEVSNQIGQTANEIQALATPRRLLKDFLNQSIENRHTQYVLLADQLETRFSDQSQGEFLLMQDDLERAIDEVRTAGGKVIRDANAAAELANELNRHLPPVNSSQASA